MIKIINGRIVTPTEVLEGKNIYIDGDTIYEISEEDIEADRTINAHGRYIFPGFIDVHSDTIEKIVNPRKTAVFDYELGLKEAEKQLLQQGITTIFHSFAMYKNTVFGESVLRKKENVLKMCDLIADLHNRNHLIHHRVHLRCEIDNDEAYLAAKELIEKGQIQEISFMDHTPGQGQYRNLEIYRKSIDYEDGKTFEDVMEYHEKKTVLTPAQMKELADLAHAKNIPVASHDDDTIEKLCFNKEIGVDISEFPITLDTAKAAKEKGFYTIFGAPNILLGGSHSGNVSAAEAILEGCGDILCSDYYPQAMLHAVFIMNKKYGVSMPEMVNKVSLNPAKATRIDDRYGSIEVGKKADLLIVDECDGYPVITHVLVDGRTTSRVEYRY
ncbi:MAG: phosphonate metabolism protein PhnM [Erysipelotrichaceae bacterium]|nr:phosphonate metabolism protein PhnM [Erysipelotrichaceae bacterium]